MTTDPCRVVLSLKKVEWILTFLGYYTVLEIENEFDNFDNYDNYNLNLLLIKRIILRS